jgi:Ca2+-transporting ATPase
MGKRGTDVAKEAADVVLADDNFSTICLAIAEGKGIFFNIRCFLAFQLSTSFAALTMASVATLFGLPTPLNAMQILWINIIMDGPPAQSLGVEPVDSKILQAKPRKADDPIVTRALLFRTISSTALIVFITLRIFLNELEDGKVSRRDTTMTFMTFVNCDLFNAYVCRSADHCFYEMHVFGNPTFLWSVGGSILGQLLVIYWTPLQDIFQTEAISFPDLLYIIVLSSSMLWLDTIRKTFFHSVFSDRYNPPRVVQPSSSSSSMTMMNPLKRIPHTGSWLDLRRSTSKALTLTNRRWSTTSSKRSSKAGIALAV